MSTIRESLQWQARVGEQTITVTEWKGTGTPLVCVPGLTSNAMAFAGLATELPDRHIVAIDCRGRGSSTHDGPFGLAQHVRDLAAVLDQAGLDHAHLVGHSFGTWVITAFAAVHPTRVDSLVLLDGGHLQFPETDVSPTEVLNAALGLYLARLDREWDSLEDYIAYYEATPIYPHGVDDYGRTHFAYDLTDGDSPLHSRVSRQAVEADWIEIIDHTANAERLATVQAPLLLLTAPGGLIGTGDPVITDDTRHTILADRPERLEVAIHDTNHHTILLSRPGAAATARTIAGFLAVHADH
ncbi:alpha/beta fold hydrolase [Nocardia sp. NPDC003693]